MMSASGCELVVQVRGMTLAVARQYKDIISITACDTRIAGP